MPEERAPGAEPDPREPGADGEPENEPETEPRLPVPEDIPPVSAEELVDGALPDDADAVEERRYPSTIGGMFYLLVLAVSGLALGIVVVGDWRLGVRVQAGALFLAALMRALLRPRDAGMLAVRAKPLDVVLLVVLGGLLLLLAGTIPDQPGF